MVLEQLPNNGRGVVNEKWGGLGMYDENFEALVALILLTHLTPPVEVPEVVEHVIWDGMSVVGSCRELSDSRADMLIENNSERVCRQFTSDAKPLAKKLVEDRGSSLVIRVLIEGLRCEREWTVIRRPPQGIQ